MRGLAAGKRVMARKPQWSVIHLTWAVESARRVQMAHRNMKRLAGQMRQQQRSVRSEVDRIMKLTGRSQRSVQQQLGRMFLGNIEKMGGG